MLSPQALKQLTWWANNVIDSYYVLTRESPDHTLTTDTSMDGWGAVFGTRSTGCLWAAHEARNHINYLELLAGFLGLQVFCQSLNNTHIRLMIDNTTALTIINHMGTCHSEVLNTLSKKLWLWCISRNIWISAAHIAGKSNQQADLESRQNKTETEWMLNKNSFSCALHQLKFSPEIDLFASRLNAQLTQYIAYRPDPGRVAIDAFSFDWFTLNFYAFPPFSVIPAVLKRLRNDKATGICVLPNWPTQAWFPLAMKMAICENVRLRANKSILHLPSRPDVTHPLHKQLSVLVCLLSGKP